jgi:isoaspartyl peptidase/L-asparaginase-like protein (Ntn-hydrolase superfamily)
VFVKALPKSMTDDIETESEDMETEDVSSMDVDFISSLVVEEDADKERAILQEAKDAKRLDKHKHTKESKEKKAVVDPYSKLEKVGVVAVDEDGSELDIMLLKAEISYSVVCS